MTDVIASAAAAPTTWDPGSFNPHDPEFLRNPYPTYTKFREQAPVARVQPYGSWWVFRHEDARTVLQDSERFLKNRPGGNPPAPAPFDALGNLPQGLFSLDAPRHTELRSLLDPLFQQAIDGMEQTAEELARTLIREARHGQRFELYSSFAAKLPPQVLFKVLGFPEAASGGLQQWVGTIVAGHDITAPVAAQAAAGTCGMALLAYFQGLARGGCPHARSGGLFSMMQDAVGRQQMQAEELQTTSVNLTVAGYLSTTFLIATGVLNLLANPAQLDLLRADPSRIPAAIEELLRYDTPLQLVDRYAAVDLELGSQQIRAGDVVTAVTGSANRDPLVYTDPDRLDISRDNSGTLLSFGAGTHYCIGAPLARKVAPAALKVLLEELPAFKLDGLPQWQTDPYIRSVSNLPLALL